MQLASAVTREASKAAPPVTVAAAALAGLDLQAWVYIAALTYTVLQIAFLCWKWVRDWREPKPPKPTVPPDR